MNAREIERYKFTGTEKTVGLGNGLYIRMRASSKTFILKMKINGKMRVKKLGVFPTLTIQRATQLAVQTKASLSDSGTLGNHIDNYYNDCILGSHNRKKKPHKRPEQALRYLNQIKEKFGKVMIDNLTKSMLATYIREYSKHGARTGEVMRVHLVSVFAVAFERGLISENPMVGVSSNMTGYAQVNRERVLSDDEIRALWLWKNNPTGWHNTEENKKVIQFLLLTGLRISEAQQGYVDGDKFRIDDTKNGKPHWVYLSDTAKSLLPLPKSTATNIQAWLKRKLGDGDRYTPHDCRRTFATRLNDASMPVHIVEKCLNHSLQGVMAVYNQAEYEQERIDAALKIEQLVLSIVSSH